MTTTAPKTGRPRLAPGERRDAQIPPVRVTAAELHFVEAQAAAAGLPLSDYARRRLLGLRVDPARSAADDALLLELNRIGTNLNQMTMRANASGAVRSEEALRQLVDELRGVLSTLAAAVE